MLFRMKSELAFLTAYLSFVSWKTLRCARQYRIGLNSLFEYKYLPSVVACAGVSVPIGPPCRGSSPGFVLLFRAVRRSCIDLKWSYKLSATTKI